MPIVPDDKSWVWVLERPCPDCGYDAANVYNADIARLIRENAARWPELLRDSHAAERPHDDQWSALEYACHVRDVFRIFDERLQRMLTDDNPRFANWDQDVTAIEERYAEQDPKQVASELLAAGLVLADRFDTVGGDQWSRPSVRSDGASFRVDSFARYLVHDPVHHVWDVEQGHRLLHQG